MTVIGNLEGKPAGESGQDLSFWLEQGRVLFRQKARFVTSAPNEAALPGMGLPEFAFAGRSNAGKSSLLNALVGMRALAHKAAAPGRTRALNFFSLGEAVMLVDFPGYGYAQRSRKERISWRRLILAYLASRAALHQLLLLIDSRRGLMQQDEWTMEMLDRTAIPYLVLLTKSDLVTRDALLAQRDAVLEGLAQRSAANGALFITSARTGEGLASLRAHIAQAIHYNSAGFAKSP